MNSFHQAAVTRDDTGASDSVPQAHRTVDFLLIGGGLASATAAETLRLEGAEGSIVVVGAEHRAPYHRPPLSGALASGKPAAPPVVLKPEDYRRLDIELITGTRVIQVEPERHLVHTDAGTTIGYRQLLIATGASPARPSLPGADLAGILTFRTAEDARTIDRAARHGKRCVVVGAGFIGMEVSSSLRQRGLKVHLVSGRGGVFGPLHDTEISKFFAGLYAGKGVDVVEAAAVAFEGIGTVRAVVLEDGRRLACDFVVAGVGVEPQVDFLRGSGIELDDGIVVDRHLRSSVPDVFAAGDVASIRDPVVGPRGRIEHWDNAVKQGRLAARNMLGRRLPYDEVSSFFCRVFDAGFQFLGCAEETPTRRSLGKPATGSWARLYMNDCVPRALFTMGRPARETATVQELIRYRTRLPKLETQIKRQGFELVNIPSQTVLVLQGGGALGAFEAGVVEAMEEQSLQPDIVAGVSIGAFNGAIIASNPGRAAEALKGFWHDLAVASPMPGTERARREWASMWVLMAGVPRFFTPRWWGMRPDDWQPWTSLYDPHPARRLLSQYVDFEALKTSPVRLLVSAVDVETAQLQVFDSYVDEMTTEHLLASGSLPPGLPWTTIGGKRYWDGGIISNSPLEQVIERCGAGGKRVVVVDLFPHKRALPTNMLEVLSRRDEIVYAERVRRTSQERHLLSDARKLMEHVVSMLDEPSAARIRELPTYVQLMGGLDGPSITRIAREASSREPAGRDFDFSLPSLRALMDEGMRAGKLALSKSSRSPEYRPGSA